MAHADLRIALVGGGNMGRAIVAGLLRSGHRAGLVAVAEPSAEARGLLAALDPGLAVGTDAAAACAGADVVVLAVKPQVLPEVATALAPSLRTGALVLSVAAGIPLASLAGWLGGAAGIVRAMPNQPAMVGEGMTVLVAGPGVTPAQREQAGYVAAATGRTAWVADEALMDAVTAVSGSGPAYFYLVMELIEQAAATLGLPPELARLLTRQTALGAARLAADPATDVAALRASVTSPGGTTAAALAVFARAGLPDIVRRALAAARDRGAKLGRGAR